jgi:hypothetical protein
MFNYQYPFQATIDYVQYLEDCIAKLKAETHRTTATPTSGQFAPSAPTSRGLYNPPPQYHTYDDEDVEMGSPENPSPTYSTPLPNSHQPPALLALQLQDSNRQDLYSSASTEGRHYSLSALSTTSPTLGPTACGHARSTASASPALLLQMDLDQEATAALLMLNTDRRSTYGSIGGRGIGARDLLSI